MNEMFNRAAFFCTQPAGWESEDFILLFSLVAGLAVLYVVNHWLKRRYRQKTVDIIRKVTVVLGTVVILTGIGLVIWIAPC